MKNLFSWRLPPSKSDFIKLWEDATFVFDTNFLLDLYRVSRTTSEDFFLILEILQNRIWLPYQVASEFLNHREETIHSEASSFQKALTTLKNWKDDQKKFNPLSGQLQQTGRILASEINSLLAEQDSYLAAVDEVEKQFREKIEELANSHLPLDPNEDHILDKILSLFDGKVGNSYDVTTLQELYKEGANRYSRKQPPGFSDAETKEDERKYGDFIFWKQILEFAKTKSCPIIFITGEKKPDWWITKNGKIISPQPQLRHEFHEQVNQPFWMYHTQRFLEIAKETLQLEINPRSIEETNAIAVEFADEKASADKQVHDSLRQVIEQMQRPVVNDSLLRSLEQMQRPVVNDSLLRSLEQMRPVVNDSLLRSLEQMRPVVNDSILRLVEQMQRPVVNDSILRLVEQMQRPVVNRVKDVKNIKAFQDNVDDLTEEGELPEEKNSETC